MRFRPLRSAYGGFRSVKTVDGARISGPAAIKSAHNHSMRTRDSGQRGLGGPTALRFCFLGRARP